MKQLADILKYSDIVSINGPTGISVSGLTANSREATQGVVFCAVKGTKVDGHDFVQQAVQSGAVAIVLETLPTILPTGITIVQVKDSAKAVGELASAFYDNPSSKLSLIGITGTNGKTTTATLCYRLFTALGYPSGLLSTIENRILDEVIPATHTTPDPIRLQELLGHMVEAGCTHAFMEVSSHAIHQKRIAALQFSGGVFTNITHDHLDYHGNFDAYLKVKKSFFDQLPDTAFALTNVDDKRGSIVLQNTHARKYTYSIQGEADFRAKIISNEITGLLLKLDGQELHTRLTGGFNAWNILAVYGVGILLQVEKNELLEAISKLENVNGRFEVIRAQNSRITGVVDYAHTPDAVEKVLQTLRAMMQKDMRIITVIGCGGDRDTLKRPIMAQIAAKYSQQLVLTSDNPRTENPSDIIRDMESGLDQTLRTRTLSITDRKEAIRTAMMLAKPGDVVLVAGKGHENYQEINGVKHPFDDKAIIAETFLNLTN